jgi:hypothetical protein
VGCREIEMFPEVNRVTGQIQQFDWRRARAKLLERDPGPRTCRTGAPTSTGTDSRPPRSHSSSSCGSGRTPWPVDQARWAKAWESKISATPGTGWLKAELRRAVSEDELVMYYQPKVDLLSGDVLGVEARLSAGGSRTRSATCDHRG